MKRLPDWDRRLSECVLACASMPYKPSRHDCLLWPAEAVRAVTGKDHGRDHRGKYRTPAGAYRYLRSLGFDSPEAYLDSLFDEKSAGFAQRGDLVLADDGIPAVCMGGFALSVGQEGQTEGLIKVPRSQWVKAWRVG